MAVVVIRIEDAANAKVKTNSHPTYKELMSKIASGHDLTAAEAYACRMLRAALEMSKEQGSLIVQVPKLGL